MCSASDTCSERHENDMAESPGEGPLSNKTKGESVKESAVADQNGVKRGYSWIWLRETHSQNHSLTLP